MNEFFTWPTLATFAGCATATAVITQFIKDLKPFKNIATQWVSYGIALVLLFAATYFTGALTGPAAALIPFNAVVIALAANGAYSAITRAAQASTANKADGDVPAGAASGGSVTVVQEDVTPKDDTQTGAAQAAEVKQETAGSSDATHAATEQPASGESGAVASGTTGAV